MNDQDMVSVPRELLERMAQNMDDSAEVIATSEYRINGAAATEYTLRKWSADLRAVLAQPVAEEQGEQRPALSYKDDPRTPFELGQAGCYCIRFGEGNRHWPCPIHPALEQAEQQPAGEIILFGTEKEVCWSDFRLPAVGTKLYAAPIAQATPHPDQSALVEALEKYADINNWDYDGCSVSPDVAEEALATYRAALSAQGGEQ